MKKILTLVICYLLCFQTANVFAATPLGTLDCLENSNEDYIFTVRESGKRFLLLDITDDKSSKFFIMGIDYYGEGAFDEFSNQRLEPELMSNASYKLNRILTGEGIKQSHTQKVYKLPENIVKYIDFNHLWKTEGTGSAKGNAKDAYTTVCGVNLLSQAEFMNHKSKIGACDEMFARKDSPRASGWWLRDGSSNGKEMLAVRLGDKPWIGTWTASDAGLFYRPIFYVSRDFFSNVPIDLKTAGKNVIEVFKEYYTAGELKQIYSDKEIYDYIGYKPPVSIKADTFTDGAKPIKHIKGSKRLCARVDVMNNMLDKRQGILAMTYYDCFAKPIDTICVWVEIPSGENQTHELELNLKEYPNEGSYVKITFIESEKIKQTNNSIKFYY